jgi:hypothetical protein
VKVFLSPEGYGKGDLADESRRCSRDYSIERSLTLA